MVFYLMSFSGIRNRKSLIMSRSDHQTMTPAELHDAHRMSLILQRDDLVKRIEDVNIQIAELDREYDESKYLI